jgi:glycosyltransferase involved in cell wall biosynthesis
MPPMRCGVGGYIYHLAEALASRNDSEVLLITSCEAENTFGPRLTVLPIIEKWNYSALFELRNIASKWGPDVIHIQYPATGYKRSMWPSFIPLFMKGIAPVIQTWHEYLSRKGLVRYLFNTFAGDALITVREKYKSHLPSWYRWLISGKRLVYIPVVSAIPKYEISDNEIMAIKQQFNAKGDRKLITYFGFVNEHKGVEAIFDVLDPTKHSLLLICELNESIALHRKILSLAETRGFAGSFFVTGYLSELEVAKNLAASDGAIFPFKDGVEECNTSFLAARMQGVFVLATHGERRGYDESENVFYSMSGDLQKMKDAISKYSGRRHSTKRRVRDWRFVADAHMQLYNDLHFSSRDGA